MKLNSIALLVVGALSLAACDNGDKEADLQITPTETKVLKPAEEKELLAIEQQAEQKAQMEQLFAKATRALFKSRAMSASMFGLSPELAGGYYADQLEDYSPQAEAALRQELAQYIKQLKGFSFSDPVDEDNRKVVASIARYYSGNPDFPIGYIDSWMGLSAFVVNQINGPMIDLPNTLQNNHPIKSLKDAQDYISRLTKFDQFIGSVNQKFLADAEQGWIPPKVTLSGALNFLHGFVSSAPGEHGLVTNFQTKLEALDISAEQKSQLLEQARVAVKDTVYPAYQELTKSVAAMLDKGREESGIWAQPNGVAFYADAVKQLGDTDLTPEQIHQVGLDEVARISKEMDLILSQNGYKEGSVGARMTALNDESRFLYSDTDEGRQELLDDLNAHIEEINQRMPEQFATKPPYAVEVRRIPVERQDGAPGGQYTPPSIDGSQPGIYWINLRDMKANPKFDLKTLTYHEANPGHHWQIALNLAQDELPFLRRIAPYNAYVEGWALYSERVAWEMGLYKDDPFGDLGRLKAELFRAVRLVVDTGLHAKKWTREQAIKYMAETTGTAASDVVSEIERYMAWPGQALGYKLGMINILNQRDLARKALKDKFDMKQFHDLILLGGAVPMSVLNEKIANWIASKQ